MLVIDGRNVDEYPETEAWLRRRGFRMDEVKRIIIDKDATIEAYHVVDVRKHLLGHCDESPAFGVGCLCGVDGDHEVCMYKMFTGKPRWAA